MTTEPTASVTVAIPVYKRMDFLPNALRSVAEQDYPNLELLISDNGENGPELSDLVAEHYPHPFTLRRNEATVSMSRHFSQLAENATGEYFVLLCDDDEIETGFVSSLVHVLDGRPHIGVAIPYVELMNEAGERLNDEEAAGLPFSQLDPERLPPRVMSCLEFVRLWVNGRHQFVSFVTTMARTQEVVALGGYPDVPTGDDDAVALRLALGRDVAFCREAVFRLRAYDASEGLAMSPWELAADIKGWLAFLDSDPVLRDFAERNPNEWPEIHRLMAAKAWRTYRHRWKTFYRARLGHLEWLRAGFALPFIPDYYRWLAAYLPKQALSRVKRTVKGRA
jgi:glycosyltransferase involved in cell wall biosynthesis